jgi:glutathione synthase/RimK-type ligase-like ATP-grasp enzyme
MPKVVIVTCRDYPELLTSDGAFRDALKARGAEVIARPWQAPAFWSDMTTGDIVVMRAAWDYPEQPALFEAWLSDAEASTATVLNPPVLMRWNTDKRYVLELARHDVCVPKTELLPGGSDPSSAFDRLDVDHAVIKPCRGSSGRGVQRVNRAGAQLYLADHAADRLFLLQELVPEIIHGELSFVFIAGRFSHIVRKIPALGEFRVNSAYGPASVTRVDVEQVLVDQAAGVLSALPQPPLYARIDGVEREGSMIWLEAEVTEPTLYMNLHPPAAERLADAVLAFHPS